MGNQRREIWFFGWQSGNRPGRVCDIAAQCLAGALLDRRAASSGRALSLVVLRNGEGPPRSGQRASKIITRHKSAAIHKTPIAPDRIDKTVANFPRTDRRHAGLLAFEDRFAYRDGTTIPTIFPSCEVRFKVSAKLRFSAGKIPRNN